MLRAGRVSQEKWESQECGWVESLLDCVGGCKRWVMLGAEGENSRGGLEGMQCRSGSGCEKTTGEELVLRSHIMD